MDECHILSQYFESALYINISNVEINFLMSYRMSYRIIFESTPTYNNMILLYTFRNIIKNPQNNVINSFKT